MNESVSNGSNEGVRNSNEGVEGLVSCPPTKLVTKQPCRPRQRLTTRAMKTLPRGHLHTAGDRGSSSNS